MVTNEYKIAYSEVLEILKYISTEEFNKIPNDMIEMFKENAMTSNNFIYDPNKTLQEQNVSELSRYIIAILFRDYWATENQRQRILAKQKYERQKRKEEMYSYDNIFKKNNNDNISKQIEESSTEIQMVEYKEPVFKRIINKLLKFLHIK
ncbi:MAG: hypothetical protein PUA90_00335 [bacterium]|nr:hypothetical protein [bacterium]